MVIPPVAWILLRSFSRLLARTIRDTSLMLKTSPSDRGSIFILEETMSLLTDTLNPKPKKNKPRQKPEKWVDPLTPIERWFLELSFIRPHNICHCGYCTLSNPFLLSARRLDSECIYCGWQGMNILIAANHYPECIWRRSVFIVRPE